MLARNNWRTTKSNCNKFLALQFHISRKEANAQELESNSTRLSRIQANIEKENKEQVIVWIGELNFHLRSNPKDIFVLQYYCFLIVT